MSIRTLVLVATLVGVHHTAHAAVDPKPAEERAIYCPDIRGVGGFKPGHPVDGEDLRKALPADDFQALPNTVELLRRTPSGRLQVVGYTDDRECVGSAACEALSLRRARFVYDWLIANGVPEKNLVGPFGKGAVKPIDTNRTEDGRSRNRRTEINVFDGKDE